MHSTDQVAANERDMLPKYVVITPVRNEGERIQATIDSVTSQTLTPHRWVIVDDGSTDRTGELIEAAAKRHAWIQGVRRPDRGFRQPGGGVIEAVDSGLLGDSDGRQLDAARSRHGIRGGRSDSLAREQTASERGVAR